MTLTVIATLHPADGRRDDLLAAVLKVVPLVLQEEGCLGYAPHTVGKDGLVIVESWASGEDLRAHGAGDALKDLQAATHDIVTAPSDVVVARPVPLDSPA